MESLIADLDRFQNEFELKLVELVSSGRKLFKIKDFLKRLHLQYLFFSKKIDESGLDTEQLEVSMAMGVSMLNGVHLPEINDNLATIGRKLNSAIEDVVSSLEKFKEVHTLMLHSPTPSETQNIRNSGARCGGRWSSSSSSSSSSSRPKTNRNETYSPRKQLEHAQQSCVIICETQEVDSDAVIDDPASPAVSCALEDYGESPQKRRSAGLDS